MYKFPNNYIGCANSLPPDDERLPKYIAQFEDEGFDDTVTWNLDNSIAEFVLPRLKRFKVVNIAYPSDLTPESWDEILDKMIVAFEEVLNDDIAHLAKLSEKEGLQRAINIEEGLSLFAKYFQDLWW